MNAARPRGLYFLDTNILVYSFDPGSPAKQATARRLIKEALATQRGMISTQVVQEFLNVALRKFARPLSVSESREYLRTVLLPLCHHYPSGAFYDRAVLLREETGLSFYDALIVTAAQESGCAALFTEDLQHGQVIGTLSVVNPFTDA
jgi:predicted nucleic acid-binding protein